MLRKSQVLLLFSIMQEKSLLDERNSIYHVFITEFYLKKSNEIPLITLKM